MNRKPVVAAAIYHSIDLRERFSLIPQIIDTVGAAFEEPSLNFVEGALVGTSKLSRQVKATEAALTRALSQVAAGAYSYLYLDELTRREQEHSRDGYASLVFKLTADRSAKVAWTDVPQYPYSVRFYCPRDSLDSADRLHRAITQVVQLLEAPYAFVHLGRDWSEALMETTFTSIFPMGHEKTAAELQQERRLLRCSVHRIQIGHLLTGAYWGNYLGPVLVDQLGGVAALCEQAPVALVAAQEDGRVYLQLMNELPVERTPAHDLAVEKLEAYLEPAGAWIRSF